MAFAAHGAGKRSSRQDQCTDNGQRRAKRSKAALCELLDDRTCTSAASMVSSDVRGDASMAARATKEVVSHGEAEALVDWARAQGFSFGWGNDDTHAARRKNYRSAHTVEVEDNALATQLWHRLRHALPSVVHVASSECDDPSSVGDWRAVGLHSRLLFVEYRDGGHFSPHADGFLVTGLHERSLFTALIYLNDVEVGGERGSMFAQIGGGRAIESS